MVVVLGIPDCKVRLAIASIPFPNLIESVLRLVESQVSPDLI
jgi:hypothetical protein